MNRVLRWIVGVLGLRKVSTASGGRWVREHREKGCLHLRARVDDQGRAICLDCGEEIVEEMGG